MSCPDANIIAEFLDGLLATTERAKLEDHFDSCSDCRVLVAELVRAKGAEGGSSAISRRDTDRGGDGGALEAKAVERIGPGTHVDHFVVIRRIGRGGMGEVFLARDENLGRKVALKIIRPGVLGDADSRKAFLREARLTARFSHPHLIVIHSVGEHEGQPYLVFEFVPGQTTRASPVSVNSLVRGIRRPVGL